jgi:hypothetical protein
MPIIDYIIFSKMQRDKNINIWWYVYDYIYFIVNI